MEDSQQTQPQNQVPQGGGHRDPLEQLKALLKKKEIMIPAGLVILLIAGLAMFYQSPPVEEDTDSPSYTIRETVNGAESYRVSFTREFLWVGGEGNESAFIETEGIIQRDGSYDLHVRSNFAESGKEENLSTQSEITVRSLGKEVAMRILNFTRVHFAGGVGLPQVEAESGVPVSGSWFGGSERALFDAAESLGLRPGVLPLGEHGGVEYFENNVVSLFADIAEISELKSDVQEGADRVRRYRIPQEVLTGEIADRIVAILGTRRPNGIGEDVADIFLEGQMSMWQDVATGFVYRVGFTTASVAEGLQVSVDYTLEDINSAPQVSLPQTTLSAADLRTVGDAVLRLSEPAEFGLQEGHLRNLWLALHEYHAANGAYPTTNGATMDIANSVCNLLVQGGRLGECPRDPNEGGFYGYRSADGQEFSVTALLDDPACAYTPTTPPNCQLNPSGDCAVILANTTVSATEDGSCIYEIRGEPGQLTGI